MNQPINQSTNQNNKTVAVVTSTIGHPELSLAIKAYKIKLIHVSIMYLLMVIFSGIKPNLYL